VALTKKKKKIFNSRKIEPISITIFIWGARQSQRGATTMLLAICYEPHSFKLLNCPLIELGSCSGKMYMSGKFYPGKIELFYEGFRINDMIKGYNFQHSFYSFAHNNILDYILYTR
jgi:hypothetical protein